MKYSKAAFVFIREGSTDALIGHRHPAHHPQPHAPPLLIDQPSLQGFCPIADAVDTLASQADADARGAVNTRPEVVKFMLDLAGYTACQPLYSMRLLESSFFGKGVGCW